MFHGPETLANLKHSNIMDLHFTWLVNFSDAANDLALLIGHCDLYFMVPSFCLCKIIVCSNIGTPKIINFPFGTNGKLMVLGVLIFKHLRVCVDPDQMVF